MACAAGPGVALGDAVALGVAVTLGVGVALGVGVPLGVGVGVGVGVDVRTVHTPALVTVSMRHPVPAIWLSDTMRNFRFIVCPFRFGPSLTTVLM